MTNRFRIYIVYSRIIIFPMSLDKITEQKIKEYNPWHHDSDFLFQKEHEYQKRQQFQQLEKYLSQKMIISLIGLRRTGKSTIIKQAINELLQIKTKPKDIFFYQFEELDIDLEGILSFYLENILKQNIHQADCYIFLDELQFIPNWQNVLKRYYDLNTDIKFIISRSTHLYLHKNTHESLAGRILDIKIEPFHFLEWLNFKYQKKYPELLNVTNIFDKNFFKIIQENRDILLFKNDFKNFLSFGEFPYFFHNASSFELENYYQKSILEKIFSHDIKFFDVENFSSFLNLFKTLNQNTAGAINISNMAREINLNKATIKRYINILEKMFLYNYISKHSKSIRTQVSSFKKGYSCSLNLLRTSLNLDYENIYKEIWGHIIETFVYNELRRQNAQSVMYDIHFYNNAREKQEVDFVLSYKNDLIPIEVKTNSEIKKNYFRGLVYFMNKEKLNKGILLYGGNEILEEKIDHKTIYCLPYFLI